MILQEPAHLTKYKQAKLISYFGPWPQLRDGRRPASSSYIPLGSPTRPFLTRWCAVLRGHWEGITIGSKKWEICPWVAIPLILLRVVTQTATGLNGPNANSLHINIITDFEYEYKRDSVWFRTNSLHQPSKWSAPPLANNQMFFSKWKKEMKGRGRRERELRTREERKRRKRKKGGRRKEVLELEAASLWQ